MANKIKDKMKSKRGFTLIELIVVIAIIAILLALAVPRITGFTETARVTSDDQLAALYRNTFNVLVAKGDLYTSSSAVVIVDKNGGIDFKSGSNELAGSTGGQVNKNDLENIQNDFIATDKSGAKSVFKSQKYPKGIEITITSGESVTVNVPTT